jgi:hypothetical protein
MLLLCNEGRWDYLRNECLRNLAFKELKNELRKCPNTFIIKILDLEP